MLNVVSSEPVSRDTKRSCVLRGSRTHCALKKALRWKSRAMKNCQVRSSGTLKFWSNLKPWITLNQSVSCNKSPFQWHLYIFIVPFSSFLLTPKPCYATHTELYSHQAMSQVKEWSPRKHQVKSRRPKKWSGTKRQPSPGRRPGAAAPAWAAAYVRAPAGASLCNARTCGTLGNKTPWRHCTEWN